MSRLAELALAVATEAHDGQVDKAGHPYIDHPVAVAESVRHHGDVHYAVALLHDVVEDSDHTAATLLDAGVPADVVDAVEALTHQPGEPRDDYYARVRANPVALVVKRADVAHNADEQRLAALPADTAQRLRRKYEKALAAHG